MHVPVEPAGEQLGAIKRKTIGEFFSVPAESLTCIPSNISVNWQVIKVIMKLNESVNITLAFDEGQFLNLTQDFAAYYGHWASNPIILVLIIFAGMLGCMLITYIPLTVINQGERRSFEDRCLREEYRAMFLREREYQPPLYDQDIGPPSYNQPLSGRIRGRARLNRSPRRERNNRAHGIEGNFELQGLFNDPAN